MCELSGKVSSNVHVEEKVTEFISLLGESPGHMEWNGMEWSQGE